MVLPEPELREAVGKGEITFTPPIEDDPFGPASIDLRPGCGFSVLQQAPGMTIALRDGLDPLAQRNLRIENRLAHTDTFGSREHFAVEKDPFMLASTFGRVSISNNLIAMVEGRGTRARAGLSMHQTAPWIQPGWDGRITLEIRNSGPQRTMERRSAAKG